MAKSDASAYRQEGLDQTSQQLVDWLIANGVEGATVLDVGGGNGTLSLELLKAGAARATIVELSGAYQETTEELAAEAGLTERVEQRVLDFTKTELPEADIVILHRVVCCYPEGAALVAAAAARAGRLLVFSFPRRVWWTRLGVRLVNGYLRLRKQGCLQYVHRPKELIAAAASADLSLLYDEPGEIWWQVAGFGREPHPDRPIH